MIWLEFDPLTDDFVSEVQGLWKAAHWRAHSAVDNDMIVDYQVVEFVDDPAYYIRRTQYDDDPASKDYTKAGCYPRPCKTLDEAKAVVEMLDAMGVN